MPMMTVEQATELEKIADHNDGKCDRCHQTIKIYHYKIAKSHANFLRSMAEEVRNTSVNDVDISTIGLAYSVRSQVTKIRQHGLIARIKDDKGTQVPRRWLITNKGWDFLNGKSIDSKVVVFNNQVLGHDGELVTIGSILGEIFNVDQPIYESTSVSQPEARTYSDVRTPQKYMVFDAKFKGRDISGRFKVSQVYELQVKKLVVGNPVEITGIDGRGTKITYADIAAFQKNWMAI